MFIILGSDGKEYGPVSARQIHEWILEGRANLQTQARRVADSTWKPLAEFTEFGAPPPAAPPPMLDPVPPIPSLDPAPASISPAQPQSPLAPREMRFLAAMVDGLLKLLCFLPTMLPSYRFLQERSLENPPPSLQEAMAASTQIMAENLTKSVPFLLALFVVQLLLISLRGQSIGKLLCGLRIVRHPDETSAGFLRGFVVRSVLPYIVQQVPLFGMMFWVVDTCFIFREDRRCVHDLAAGTKVVSVTKSRS